MIKVNAKKDGNGNVIITEDSFEMILACLDNQKFVHEAPQNGDSLSVGENSYKQTQESIQETIDEYNRDSRKVLHQKYIFEAISDGYWLTKRYEHQEELTPWSGKDVSVVYELFKDTRIEWVKPENLSPITEDTEIKAGDKPLGIDENGFVICEPEFNTPWLIERPIRYDNDYLTISENGKTNRPWKQEEIEQINKLLVK